MLDFELEHGDEACKVGMNNSVPKPKISKALYSRTNILLREPEKEKDNMSKKTKDAPRRKGKLKEELKKETKTLKEKNESLKEQLLRLRADFENYKKRTSKERETFIKNASESLIIRLLPILDNFQKALDAKENNENNTENNNFLSYAEGIKIVHSQLLEILKNEGLLPIETEDKLFDPNYHEAIMQIETKDFKDNQIIEEYQKGYLLNNKLIRPSKVSVAKNMER